MRLCNQRSACISLFLYVLHTLPFSPQYSWFNDLNNIKRAVLERTKKYQDNRPFMMIIKVLISWYFIWNSKNGFFLIFRHPNINTNINAAICIQRCIIEAKLQENYQIPNLGPHKTGIATCNETSDKTDTQHNNSIASARLRPLPLWMRQWHQRFMTSVTRGHAVGACATQQGEVITQGSRGRAAASGFPKRGFPNQSLRGQIRIVVARYQAKLECAEK